LWLLLSYASDRGFRPMSRAEKQVHGFKPTSRAYINDASGEAISHRSMQSRGIADIYGGEAGRGALERRAAVREELYGMRSPRKTFDKMVHRNAVTSVKNGGMGAKFDKRTRRYSLPDGQQLTFQEVAASPEFRAQETGAWSQWQRIRHNKGPRGQRQRFSFLRDYGFFRFSNGKWRYVG
jgi:hypothetical protein